MTSSTTPVLSMQDVTIQVRSGSGWRDAVRNIDLDLMPGEVTALVGESGSGKSLTALAAMGLLQTGSVRVSSGTILLDGTPIVGASESEMRHLRGSKIAMIFQEPMTALNPLFRVGTQIEDVIRAHSDRNRKEARARAHECLEMVGIPANRAKAYPHELSGGMRQRVLIAMAVACEPLVLIADEPTTALDVTVQAQIIDLLGSMVDRLGMAMMFISHDFGVVADIADRVNVMLAGEVVESGGVREMYREAKHEYTLSLMHMARGEWLSQGPAAKAELIDELEAVTADALVAEAVDIEAVTADAGDRSAS